MSKRESGEGTYYREGKYFCWRLRKGGIVLATVKAGSAAERKKRVAARLIELKESKGPILPRQNMKTGDYLDWWLANHIQGNRSSSTYRQYEQAVRLYIKPSLESVALQDLTSSHVRAMMRSLGDRDRPLSPRTRESALDVLRNALNDATLETPPIISVNPALPVEPPKKGPVRKRTLKPDAVADLRGANVEGRYGPLIDVLLSTGVRYSEGLGLTWDNVDFTAQPPVIRILQRLEWYPAKRNEAGEVVEGMTWALVDVKKPRSRRSIPLGPKALAALKLVKETQDKEVEFADGSYPDHNLVFTTAVGTPVYARNLQRALDAALKRSGLGHVGLNDLRKTVASQLARDGVPMNVVQDWLGHESITTTAKHYMEVITDDMAKAAVNF